MKLPSILFVVLLGTSLTQAQDVQKSLEQLLRESYDTLQNVSDTWQILEVVERVAKKLQDTLTLGSIELSKSLDLLKSQCNTAGQLLINSGFQEVQPNCGDIFDKVPLNPGQECVDNATDIVYKVTNNLLSFTQDIYIQINELVEMITGQCDELCQSTVIDYYTNNVNTKLVKVVTFKFPNTMQFIDLQIESATRCIREELVKQLAQLSQQVKDHLETVNEVVQSNLKTKFQLPIY